MAFREGPLALVAAIVVSIVAFVGAGGVAAATGSVRTDNDPGGTTSGFTICVPAQSSVTVAGPVCPESVPDTVAPVPVAPVAASPRFTG